MKENKINEITYKAIGIVSSPFKEPKNTPIQPKASRGAKGIIEIFPKYVDGLKDLDGFSHLILLSHFHLAKSWKLHVTPFLDTEKRGVFATRAPSRPNPIGFSIVRLLKIKENKLYIQDIDLIDGTPILDIKPHVPEFLNPESIKIGWLKDKVKNLDQAKDDGRFAK